MVGTIIGFMSNPMASVLIELWVQAPRKVLPGCFFACSLHRKRNVL